MDAFISLSSLLPESMDLVEAIPILPLNMRTADNDDLPLVDADYPGGGYGSFCTIA
jgi:hypothetical protein